LGIAVAWLVIWSGVVSVAATSRGGWLDRVLLHASTRSIRHHAKDEKNPLASDPQALKKGLQLYRAMCVGCHGAPGREPEEFAAGLNPLPPDLASVETQAFTDGMLYETISSGIRSTGMPAFVSMHKPDEIWSIVAFVRHLPELTDAESESLGHGPPGRAGGGPQAAARKPAEAAKPGEHTHEVLLTRFSFVPTAITVSQGDTVTFTNQDFVAHTATAKDGTFDTGKLEAGQSKKIVASKKGTFPYFCRYHPRMVATLTVQ
jgi:plastocyanin/mono/diheme cytochrome c family protein